MTLPSMALARGYGGQWIRTASRVINGRRGQARRAGRAGNVRRMQGWIARVGGVALITGLLGAWLLGAGEPAEGPVPAVAPTSSAASREAAGTTGREVLAGLHAARGGAAGVTRVLDTEEPVADAARAALDAPAGPAPPFVVGVHVSRSYTGTADPVPDVRVEAGVGIALDPATSAVASASTGSDGNARIELPRALANEARTSGRPLWVRLAHPGYGSRPHTVAWPEAREAGAPSSAEASTNGTDASPAKARGEPDVQTRLMARAGVSLTGRLYGPDGEPCCGSVRLESVARDGTPRSSTLGVVTEQGWFEVNVNQPGTYELRAEAPSGTALIGGVAIREGERPEPLEVFLRGPGVVRGRVRDTAGAPAAGLELLVIHADVGDETGSMLIYRETSRELAGVGAGHLWQTLATDSSGGFEARGLMQGSYVVRARTSPDPWAGYPHLLTSGSVPADGRPFELVFGRPHLLVRVVDENGALYAGELRGERPRGGAGGPDDEWPDVATVVCAPQWSDAVIERLYLPCASAGEGEFVFEVDEERTYLVGVFGGATSSDLREVFVPLGAGRIEVVLTIGAKAPGTLAISVEDSAGTPVPSLMSGIALRIECATSRLLLVFKDFFNRDPWPQVFELPPGPYRVVVEGAPTMGYHGTLLSARKLGRYETLVDVRPDATQEVTARMSEGARLRLALEGQARDEDRAAWSGLVVDDEVVASWAEQAEVVLLPEGGWPVPVQFRWEVTGSTAEGTRLVSSLSVGSEDTSEVLPAGRYRLQARLPGGRVATTEVVLRDGETTAASLTFR